jgi:hypothetical protein
METTNVSGHGPTRTSRGMDTCVGCLRTSGLVMLAARCSEFDPQRHHARKASLRPQESHLGDFREHTLHERRVAIDATWLQ